MTLAGVVEQLLASSSKGEGELRLKWPNDLLLGGAKLSGILLGAGAGLVVDYRVLLAVVGAASLTGAVVVLPRRIRR